MIEKTKCESCKKVYELIWDDTEIADWADDYDDGFEEDDDENFDDPVYCPFCGTHIDYVE